MATVQQLLSPVQYTFHESAWLGFGGAESPVPLLEVVLLPSDGVYIREFTHAPVAGSHVAM